MRILVIIFYKPSKDGYHDGFSAGIEHIEKIFDKTDNVINTINLEWESLEEHLKTNSYDIGILKTQFGCGDKHARLLRKYNILVGMVISSIGKGKDDQLPLYDVLFYQTEWYRKYSNLDRHKCIFHAFGVDTSIMKKKNLKKEYDIIMVGTYAPWKRHYKLEKMAGKRITIGDMYGNFKNPIIKSLKKSGVIVKDYVTYDKLCDYINKSKLCYIPCDLGGGGERAVLEARACGVPIKIEDDNPKLKTLLNSPLYDYIHYGEQILKGCKVLINKNLIDRLYFNKKLNIPTEDKLLDGEIKKLWMGKDSFLMHNKNDLIIKNIRQSLGWNGFSIRLWYKLSKSADTILDIGGYTGIYSLISASSSKNSKIYTFEIDKNNYDRIVDNIKLNNFENITAENIGISDKIGESKYMKKINSNNNLYYSYYLNRSSNSPKDSKAVNIKTNSIDNFLKNKSVNNLIIKMSVNNDTEQDVIKGMDNTIQKYYPNMIIECTEKQKIKLISKKYPKYNCFKINDYDMKIVENIKQPFPNSNKYLLTTMDYKEVKKISKDLLLL